ncbi:MAG: NADH-quinone oxidoreductase subunit N, partial [Candidatus Hydrogenedentes bacterium]|nr:NADH-quinone oxidoreductase subunit N [Candidatus Hydrogenedentota bacterium]
MMTVASLSTLTPLLRVAAAAVGLLLMAALRRNADSADGWPGRPIAAAWTVAALVLAALSVHGVNATTRQITPLLIIDDYSLFYFVLIFLASAVTAVLSYVYWRGQSEPLEEYYILLLCATLGAGVLAASTHFVAFFLGLELLSVSLYALIAYSRRSELGTEAALKYLVLAAGSASILLFGMALVYAETGSMQFARIATAVSGVHGADRTTLSIGLALMIVGLGFKLALVPFHLWTPDVYEGAPAPVTAFIASVSKGAVFAFLLRYFSQVDIHAHAPLDLAFTIIAVASMFIGNLLALLQNNVKRILAYSSIAHLGYLLVAFLSSGPLASVAVAFYLTSYFVTSLGAFGVITVLSRAGDEPDTVDDYRGLFWRRPWVAAVFIAMLMSLAGIPLTAGFIGKFYLVAAGANSARWLLVFALVINSAIGLFYYLRIILALIAEPDTEQEPATKLPPVEWVGGSILACLTFALVAIGVYPAPLIA